MLPNTLLFILRFIKHLAILLLVSLPLQLVSILLLPFVVPFYDIGKLPRCLRYFDSADPFLGRDTSVIERINRGGWLYEEPVGTPSRLSTIFNKYVWLALRNPLNYFGYTVLGFKIESIGPSEVDSKISIPVQTIKAEVGDASGKYPGTLHTEMVINDKNYYEYYFIFTYTFKGVRKCVRIRIGYKIGDPSDNKIGDYVQQVFVISPFHDYSGII